MTDRKKILVVEDDHFMNESLCIFLGNAGYDTLGVFDGTSALREFENYKPDLIMLDVMIQSRTESKFAKRFAKPPECQSLCSPH